MDTKKLNEIVDDAFDSAEEEVGYELSEDDLELSRKIISQLSGYYMRKDQKITEQRKIKSKTRKANKVARKQRKTNKK